MRKTHRRNRWRWNQASWQRLLEKGTHPKAPTANLLIRIVSPYPRYSGNTQPERFTDKKDVFQQTSTTVSFDGQHRGRKPNRKTSHRSIAITRQMSGYKIWPDPNVPLCQFKLFVHCHKKRALRPEHRQQGWKGRNGRAEQRLLTSNSRMKSNLLNCFWQVKLGT